MKTTKLFKKRRRSKEFRCEGDEMLPRKKCWDSLVESLTQFSSDFMTDRGQIYLDKKEKFIRAGRIGDGGGR